MCEFSANELLDGSAATGISGASVTRHSEQRQQGSNLIKEFGCVVRWQLLLGEVFDAEDHGVGIDAIQ